MRVLCVAEKPSASKKLAEVLSQNRYTTVSTNDPHIKNYEFTYNIQGQAHQFIMTALKGHLMEQQFDGPINRNWNDYPIEDLFRAPLTKVISSQATELAQNIRNQIRTADILFIWTDCDREGEAIGGDLEDLCRDVKPNITTWRARFSSMLPPAIHHAAQHHEVLDMRQVEAVRTRSELDLRIGSAYTRFQTINLRSYLRPHSSTGKNKVLSYGSCQFPTLGFVVDRYLQVENFIPEQFWKIVMTDIQQREGNAPAYKTTFNWRRTHLFDRFACFIFYEICIKAKFATVTKVDTKPTKKWKPLPLTTVDMQKVGTRMLHLSGQHIMTIAEELYTAGLISYPRTETDQYEAGFNFMEFIEKQTTDPQWGECAQLLRDGEFERPRNGRNNDKAHPPIHPTGYDPSLSGDKKRVYELIVRRFLGSCWKNAIGQETTVEVKMGTEYFDTKGLVILERNYLEVYTYDKWTGNEIPEYRIGSTFIPESLLMEQGHTAPPKYLTESDLIALMEKNEIGTDATIAEHIQKIQDREYVYKDGQYFKPLTLGVALILGYEQIGLEASLSRPFLRRQMEADLKSICVGTLNSQEVSTRSIQKYFEMFEQLKVNFVIVKRSMDTHFREEEDAVHAANHVPSGGIFGGGGGGGGDQGHGNSNSRGGSTSGRGGRGRGSNSNSNTTTARGGRGRGQNSNRGSRGNNASRGRGRGRGGNTTNTNNTNHNNNDNNSDNNPFCQCNQRSVERTVSSVSSPNIGRKFYTCAQGRDQGCNFFLWVDDA